MAMLVSTRLIAVCLSLSPSSLHSVCTRLAFKRTGANSAGLRPTRCATVAQGAHSLKSLTEPEVHTLMCTRFRDKGRQTVHV